MGRATVEYQRMDSMLTIIIDIKLLLDTAYLM